MIKCLRYFVEQQTVFFCNRTTILVTALCSILKWLGNNSLLPIDILIQTRWLSLVSLELSPFVFSVIYLYQMQLCLVNRKQWSSTIKKKIYLVFVWSNVSPSFLLVFCLLIWSQIWNVLLFLANLYRKYAMACCFSQLVWASLTLDHLVRSECSFLYSVAGTLISLRHCVSS